MPQKNFSDKIGKSTSKLMQKVIDNNKNVQQPGSAPAIIKQQHNKQGCKP